MSLISNEEEVIWYDKFLGYYLQQPELLFTHVWIWCYILTIETKITNYIAFNLVKFGHFITLESCLKISQKKLT